MQLNGHELLIFLEAVAASGVAVWVLAKLLKKVAHGHLDDDIHKVVVVLAAVASYAQYVDQIHAVLPPYIMGVSLASIYGVSQLVYKTAKAVSAFLGRLQDAADAPAPAAAPTMADTAVAQAKAPVVPPEASF